MVFSPPCSSTKQGVSLPPFKTMFEPVCSFIFKLFHYLWHNTEVRNLKKPRENFYKPQQRKMNHCSYWLHQLLVMWLQLDPSSDRNSHTAHPTNQTQLQASLEKSKWLRGKGFCFVYWYWGFLELSPGHHPAQILPGCSEPWSHQGYSAWMGILISMGRSFISVALPPTPSLLYLNIINVSDNTRDEQGKAHPDTLQENLKTQQFCNNHHPLVAASVFPMNKALFFISR